MADVIVIGAGPAGLCAALDAAEAGHHCTLVEASASVGGMAGSFEFAGQRVDYGSHRLHAAIGERHRARFERLLGEDLQLRPRNGRIRLHDRWIGFPLRTVDLLMHLPWSFGLRVAADLATGPLRRRCGTSFDAEVRARLGATVAAEFYGPYARKLYGVEPTELDAELARRRVSATGGGEVLQRVIRAARPAGRQFLYPRNGYGQLSEALATAAVDAGVELHLNTTATSLELNARGATLHLRSSVREGPNNGDSSKSFVALPDNSRPPLGECPNNGEGPLHRDGPLDGAGSKNVVDTLTAEVILSTLPIPTLASVLNPGPPPAVGAALARCRSRAMVLAYLAVDQDRYTEFDAHYFPGPQTRVARLSEPKNYRDGDDPAQQTVLCAEIPCWPDDEIWCSDDVRIAEIATADLERSGLPPVHASGVTIRRLRSVYPVFESATMADRATLNAWVGSLAQSNLLSFGRQGLAVPDNLHHVLDMGEGAAHALSPDGTVEADRWLASLNRYADHIVED